MIGAAKSKHAINDYLPDNIGQKELNIGAIVGYHDSIVRLELCGCETQDKTIIPAIGNSPDSYYSIVYKK